jgi:uncharacterized protein (TIGR02271 family)
MSTAAVGLFENKAQAQNALQELVNAGFQRINIELISRNGGAAGTEDFSGQLARIGVPDEDARLYSSRLSGGKAVVAVQAPDNEVEKAESILERSGAVQLDDDGGVLTSQLTASPTEAIGTAGTARANSQETVIPVIEEELQVGKRATTRRRVRIYPRIVDEPVDEQISLRQEHVEVQRRPVDRPVEEHDLNALKQGAVEMSETSEEPVVQKKARVVEEIVVSKDVKQENRNVHDTVRKTEVNVDEGDRPVATKDVQARSAPRPNYSSAAINAGSETDARINQAATKDDPVASTSGMPSSEPWKKHANQALGTMTDASTAMGDADVERMKRESSATDVESAHRYGTMLANDPRYKGKEWGTIEPEAEREWPQHEKGAWQEFKDMVRHAWEKMSGDRS